LPLALVIALAVHGWLGSPTLRRRSAALAGVGLVTVGSLMAGWPPAWERLPGRFLVSGFESGVTPEGLDAARWAGEQLTPNSRVAADATNATLFSTAGNLDLVRDISPLFYSTRFRAQDRELVLDQDIRYVVADDRLTQQLPASGSYFPVDPQAFRHTEPLDPQGLAKFDDVPGVSRVFDSGHIVVYDLQDSSYDE